MKRRPRGAIFAALLAFAMAMPIYVFAEYNEIEYEYQEYESFGLAVDIESDFHILVDVATGHIISGRGIHERAYPASITKLMTALLLLESGADFDERIHHSQLAVFSIPRNTSNIAMDFDETLSVSQALHAIMLRSCNIVSNAIAEFVGGTMENFSIMMTARAHELGAINTNFTNAHGLNNPDHFTTAYDMHLIMREAITHPKLLEVIATVRYDIPPTEKQPEYRILFTTNRMITPTNAQFCPYIIGGKTGWTTPSGHTFVAYGRRGDIGLVSVVLGGHGVRDIIFTDTRKLMDYGFDNFGEIQIFSGDFAQYVELVQRVGHEGLRVGAVPIRAEGAVFAHLPLGFDISAITSTTHISDRIWLPVDEGIPVGRIDFALDGRIIGAARLLTASAAPALNAEAIEALFPTPQYAEYVYTYHPTLNNNAFIIAIIALAAVALAYLIVKAIRNLSFGRGNAPYGYVGNRRRPYRAYRYKYK